MEIEIKKTKIHYIDYGNKDGKPLIFLHGWGQNIEMMKPIADAFTKDNRIIILDFPGFGESEEPNTIWSIEDFADMVHELVQILHIENPILLGHSFGGKVTLMYASKYQSDKIVLFASPYRKEIQKLSTKTKVLKSLKKVPGLNKLEEFAKKHIGSTDYKNASPTMRQILVNHVNLDLTEDVKKIHCPALLIWGTIDEAVSLEDAYKLEKLIHDAAVIELEGGTHYAYLEFRPRVISIVRSFIA